MPETEQRGNCLARIRNERRWLRPQRFAGEPPCLQLIGLREEFLLSGKPLLCRALPEAIAAAKMRARDVARRHPGQESDTFRLMDASGKIVGVFPKNPTNQR